MKGVLCILLILGAKFYTAKADFKDFVVANDEDAKRLESSMEEPDQDCDNSMWYDGYDEYDGNFGCDEYTEGLDGASYDTCPYSDHENEAEKFQNTIFSQNGEREILEAVRKLMKQVQSQSEPWKSVMMQIEVLREAAHHDAKAKEILDAQPQVLGNTKFQILTPNAQADFDLDDKDSCGNEQL